MHATMAVAECRTDRALIRFWRSTFHRVAGNQQAGAGFNVQLRNLQKGRTPVNPAEEFRKQAAECTRMAASVRDATEKSVWRKMAERWLAVRRCPKTSMRWPRRRKPGRGGSGKPRNAGAALNAKAPGHLDREPERNALVAKLAAVPLTRPSENSRSLRERRRVPRPFNPYASRNPRIAWRGS